MWLHTGLSLKYTEMDIDKINKHVLDNMTNIPTLDKLYEIDMKNGIHSLNTDPILI